MFYRIFSTCFFAIFASLREKTPREMRHCRILMLFFIAINTLTAQTPYGSEPLAHTYSIVARDTMTGEMGVAVQSHWFSVGTIVSWGEAGVGVIATQSFVNPSFGPRGLELLKQGMTARQALDTLIASDDGRAVRQLAIVDSKGNVAVHTGSNCIPFAGHHQGNNYSVQANLMRNDRVWPAMAQAFEKSEGPLADRMLIAMEAGEAAGGDIRGKQSVAILVVGAKSTNQIWLDRKVDLQIADHPDPLGEMRRLLTVHQAYEYMNRGDLALENGDVEAALISYRAAEDLIPDNEEMQYWHAVSLANIGRVKDALPIFLKVFQKNADWKELTPRVAQVGLLRTNPADLQKILSLK